jgi:hypothetical protein
MRGFILIGQKVTDAGIVPVNLYTGLDGVAMEKAAAEALQQKDVKWSRIERFNNPQGVPMPIDPTPITASTPIFTKPKPVVYWQPPTENPLEKAARESAKKRLNSPKLDNGKLVEKETKLPSGPTLEEFMAAGYPAEGYPPHGYSAVDSPGMQALKAGKITDLTAAVIAYKLTTKSSEGDNKAPEVPSAPPEGKVAVKADQEPAAAPVKA